ncbi:MAG: hypothetical protein IJZ30_02380 [Alphaproteobacteria bacterium]|nr:hypothetical protein [Alphaproteobacteria bacterium]
MLNIKSIKLLTKAELSLWFYSFIFLCLGFSPVILDFIWGNHDWLPILNGNALHSGLIEGRITQYIFLCLFLDGKILPIINTTLGFLVYTLSIVILNTRFFEFKTSQLKSTIIIISIATLSYINEIIYFQFIVFSQLFWPLIISLSLIFSKKATCSHFAIFTLISTILLYLGIAGYPASANLFATGTILYLLHSYDNNNSFTKTLKKLIPFAISFIIAFICLYFSYQYLKSQNLMKDMYNNNISNPIQILLKLPNILLLSIKSLLQPQPFFSITYKIISFFVILIYSITYLTKSQNKINFIVRLFFIILTFLAIKFSAILTEELETSYFPKYDPIAFMVRTDFFAIPCFLMFSFFFIMQASYKILQNITIISSFLLFFINLNQNLDYSKTQILGFTSETNLLNRITNRIESFPKYKLYNYYTVVQTGDIPLRSRYYQSKPFEKYGYYNKDVALVRHWLPHEFYNFYTPVPFVLASSAINSDDLTPDMISFLATKVETWPSPNSIYVNDKYAIVALSEEGRRMLKEQFNSLIRNH